MYINHVTFGLIHPLPQASDDEVRCRCICFLQRALPLGKATELMSILSCALLARDAYLWLMAVFHCVDITNYYHTRSTAIQPGVKHNIYFVLLEER